MTHMPTLFEDLEGAPTREDGATVAVRGSALSPGSDSGGGVSTPSNSPAGVPAASRTTGNGGQVVPNTSPRARTTDPKTAQAAAESIEVCIGAECSLVLATIVAYEETHPNTKGVTAYQVVRTLEKVGVARQQNCVARRIKDLRDDGYVTDSGETRPGSKGRHTGPRGGLTDEQVREVRRLAAAGVSRAELATRFDVTRRYLAPILRGQRRVARAALLDEVAS